jgi:integrase
MAQRLYKRPDSPNWYTTIAGRARSTRCRDRRAAEARSAAWEREAYAPPRDTAATVTVEEAIGHAMTDREQRGRARGTLDMWGTKAGHLLRLLGRTTALAEIDARAVDAYCTARLAEPGTRGRGVSRNTIGKELGVLAVTLKLAARRDEYPHDVARVMPAGWGSDYKPRTRSLTPEEARRLLADLLDDDLPMIRGRAGRRPKTPGPATSSYDRTRQRSMRNRAACVAFCVATSARWSEAERARREDVLLIDDAPAYVILRGTKTEDALRTVPLTARTAPLVALALEHGREAGELFTPWQNVRRDLHAACRRLGIPPVSPNDLRRTTGQWLRDAGVETDFIYPVLGHKDSRMVQRIYTKITPEALGEALRARVGGGVVPLLPKAKAKGKKKARTG